MRKALLIGIWVFVALVFAGLMTYIAYGAIMAQNTKEMCRVTWKSEAKQFDGQGGWYLSNRPELSEWAEKRNKEDPEITYGVECKP